MELETQIVDISEDALNELFNETPDKTVNADTLLGGKKAPKTKSKVKPDAELEDEELEDEEQEEQQKAKSKASARAKSQLQLESNTIEDLSEEDLNDEEPEETEEEPEEETETEEEDNDDKKGTKRAAKAELVNKGKQVEEEEKGEVFSVLKSTVDYLVSSGVWQDFEGREDMEITEETYGKLVAEQDKLRVETMFSELVDSTGPFGKAIIEYVKNGGNPDEIIDLFKEQKSVESIKTDTPEGQKDLIKYYYTEVMGWKPEKADKYISTLVLSNELEPEAAEVKDLFTNYYKKEAERLNNERGDFVEKQKQAEKDFENNIRGTVKGRKDLSPTEKKIVEDSLLRYDQRLPNGNMVNRFYVEFMRMQADPNEYVDLVLYVIDKQRQAKKTSQQEQSKAAAKAFSFIKGNGAVSTKKGTGYDQIKKNEKVSSFDWGLPKR
jgi:hypothetical protein